MQDFDIFVHPPITPDPFPGVVLEASIAGCPIVASYIGGIPEIVQHEFSGLLVQPGIPDAFSNSIIYLLKHPEIAIQLGQNAYKSVQQFTIEHTVTKVEQVYHQLLSEQ
jgi:glycosyltransferase involved in cell wall biosynthesis